MLPQSDPEACYNEVTWLLQAHAMSVYLSDICSVQDGGLPVPQNDNKNYLTPDHAETVERLSFSLELF